VLTARKPKLGGGASIATGRAAAGARTGRDGCQPRAGRWVGGGNLRAGGMDAIPRQEGWNLRAGGMDAVPRQEPAGSPSEG